MSTADHLKFLPEECQRKIFSFKRLRLSEEIKASTIIYMEYKIFIMVFDEGNKRGFKSFIQAF